MNNMPDYTTIWLDECTTPNRDWHARQADAVGKPVEYIRADIAEKWRKLASNLVRTLGRNLSDEITDEDRQLIERALEALSNE
jgi:hypothetical protein